MEDRRDIAQQAERVYRACYALLGSTEAAEQAAESVFREYASIEQSFATGKEEDAWLLSCACKTCRSLAADPGWEQAVSMPEIEDAALRGEMSDALAGLFALSLEHRECAYLFFCEGCSAEEIASLCGLPEVVVQERIAQAREMLGAVLGGM